jgi:hypothetical protein
MERVRIHGNAEIIEQLMIAIREQGGAGDALAISPMKPANTHASRPALGQSPLVEIVIEFSVGIASSAAWDGAKAFVAWLRSTTFAPKVRTELVSAEDREDA